MRKHIAISVAAAVLAASSVASASVQNPFYIGAQVGVSFVHYTNAQLAPGFAATQILNNGVAPKLTVGYAFSQYLATELSVIWFHKPKFNGIPGTTGTQKILNNLVSLVAKISLPIPVMHKLHVFFKGGIGYIARGRIRSGATTVLASGNFLSPVYGAGAEYILSPHWSLMAEWNGAPGNSAHRLPASNWVGAGAAYHFSV